MNKKLGRDDRRGEEAGEVVEVSKSDLAAGVGEVTEIPGDEIVDAVERGDGVVDGVGDDFAVKESTVDAGLGEDAASSVKSSWSSGFTKFK